MRELEVGSGSGGNAPANANIDLHQFFNQMGEHMDRHLSRLSEHNRELLLNVTNREVVQEGPPEPDSMDSQVFKVLRELRGFPDNTFKGYQDPAFAEEWLFEMEFRFDSLGVTDALLKAKVAQNLFSGSAVQWWKGRRAVYGNVELTWMEFRKIFLEKYVSLTYINKMKTEFLKLVQGTDTVSVYTQKFDEYSRYVPEYVATEADRIWKFREGLNMRIRTFIASAAAKTYQEVVEQALE